MPRLRLALSLLVSLDAACTHAETAPSQSAVLAELSRRSATPEPELREVLAHCDQDQRSTNLCAFRDVVAADLSLDAAIADKIRELPACEMPLERGLERFRNDRKEQCERTAAAEAGGGSLEPTAGAMCITDMTRKMIIDVRKKTDCTRR
jgi:uncharacterized protein YecT (DUF1311 family)